MKNPTKQRRLTAAVARAERALSLFTRAADELDAVAAEAAAVAAEAGDEINTLIDLRDDATERATSARIQATKIREFVK